MGTMLLPFIIGLIILIAVFFILRSVNLWYWKIDQRIELMTEQNQLLRQLVEKSGGNGTILEKSKGIQNQIVSSFKKESEEIADSFFILIKEAKGSDFKDKNSLRGKIVTLSLKKNHSEVIAIYKEKYGVDLFDDIKSISSDSSKVNYVLDPVIEMGITKGV